MECSMPGFPVHLACFPVNSWSLLKLMSIESVMPSNHLVLCHIPFSSCLQSFPESGYFPRSQLFASSGQSTRVSASISVGLRVLWTARRSNQSILKKICSEYSLEGLMLKLKLQYFGHPMRRANSSEKTLMLRVKAGGEGDMTEDEVVGWHH